MESLVYLSKNFSVVDDMNSFYKERLPEIIKIRALINAIKLLYSLPGNRVLLEVTEGGRIYRISILSTSKLIVGQFVYLPLQSRLDLFSGDNPMSPILQWKKKKLVYNSLPMILSSAGVDKVFSKIINVI